MLSLVASQRKDVELVAFPTSTKPKLDSVSLNCICSCAAARLSICAAKHWMFQTLSMLQLGHEMSQNALRLMNNREVLDEERIQAG